MVNPLSQCILILGPHRSGTSALTGVLKLLGVDLGDELLPPKLDNPRGYWEHSKVFELHEELLSAVGSSWHDTRPMPLGWQELEDTVDARRNLRSFLEETFRGQPLWGVKDPRLCRLLPLWVDVLEELGVDARFVILVRNPIEVAHSLERRNRFSFHKSLMLYLSEMLAAIAHTAGRPRTFVSYAALLKDWREVVIRAGAELQIAWPDDPTSHAQEVADFLSRSERHHRADLEDLVGNPLLPSSIAELHEALEGASQGHLDDLAPAFHAADHALRSATSLLGPEVESLKAEVARLSSQLEALEHRDSERQRIRLERRAERAESELAKVQAHLTALLSRPRYRLTRRLRRVWSSIPRIRG